MKRIYFLLVFIASNLTMPVSANNGAGQTVAVIDFGFDKNVSAPYLNKSACFSQADSIQPVDSFFSDFPTTVSRRDFSRTDYQFRNGVMSKCPNGRASQSGSSIDYARNMPTRKKDRYDFVRNWSLVNSSPRIINSSFLTYYSEFTIKHGSNVVRQVQKTAPSSRIFPITIGSFNKSLNCTRNNRVEERYNQSSLDFYANYLDRYVTQIYCGNATVDNILDSLEHVLNNSSGVTAVNISAGVSNAHLCNAREGADTVTKLNDKGIVVVASVGNINGLNVFWPACLSNVIGVAQTDGTGRVIDSSIRDNKQDFFYSGFANDYQTGDITRGTSIAAPKVAGIYATLKSINPNASITDITNILTSTGSRIGSFAGRRINFAEAIEEIGGIAGTPTTPPPTTTPTPPTGGGATNPNPAPRPPTPVGQTASLGITDDTLYRQAVTFFVNLNGSASPAIRSSNINIPVSDLRDIRLDFDGLFYTSVNPSSLAGIDIVVNGVPRITFNSLIHSTHNRFYRKHSFTLNRNWLRSGNNSIEIKKSRLNRSSMTMRVTKVRMEYNEPIAMRFGDSIGSLYGHRVGSKRHLTGLRVAFSGGQSDVDFSVTGFDIDTNTEVAVFLNNTRVGYLTAGGNNRNNSGNRFKFRKDDLISSGVNTIEFVQTSSSDSETWGVSNLTLDGASPDISGVIMMLLSDD